MIKKYVRSYISASYYDYKLSKCLKKKFPSFLVSSGSSTIYYHDENHSTLKSIFKSAHDCANQKFIPNDPCSYTQNIINFCNTINMIDTSLFSYTTLENFKYFIINGKKSIVKAIFKSVFEDKIVESNDHGSGVVEFDRQNNRYVYFIIGYIFPYETDGISKVEVSFGPRYCKKGIILSCPASVVTPNGKILLDNPCKLYIDYLLELFDKNYFTYEYRTDTHVSIDNSYPGYAIGCWLPLV